MMNLKSFGKALVRRKRIDDDVAPSTLNRCLNTLDLTALGIGSTLGLGMYVIAGQVASKEAGPAVVLSFLFAALASIFAGFCYAEFGARVPRAGSAYIYSYVTVGEFTAFVIGWNLILEYVIGTASVARGYSGYLDSLFNGTIAHHFEQWMPIGIKNMSAYPDFLAFGITLLLTVMLAIGVRESTRFNSIFTTINLGIVLFVIICGSFKSDFKNWRLDPEKDNLPEKAGKGGFLPFGFSGMMAGAATCFYSFIGFDVIATTGEEVRNPQKAIPISIVTSLLIIFFAYFGVSSIQTLMWPYYDLDNPAPLPYVFDMVGYPFAKWVITVGALAGLSTSLLGAMFPLPRVLYAMATDGLIFRNLANVNSWSKTPLLATMVSGLLSGAMAALFDVSELADMMSIGTLLAYTLVAVSILILRYGFNPTKPIESCLNRIVNDTDTINANPSECEPLNAASSHSYEGEKDPTAAITDRATSPEISSDDGPDFSTSPFASGHSPGFFNIINHFIRRIFNVDQVQSPDPKTSSLSKLLIVTICTNVIILDLLLIFLETNLSELEPTSLAFVGLSLFYLIGLIFALSRQPRSAATISFQVPWVPVIPIISIFINVYLMMKLSIMTWIRFAVWMIIGLVNYFGYALRNSTGYMTQLERNQTLGITNIINNDLETSSRPGSPDDSQSWREERPLLA